MPQNSIESVFIAYRHTGEAVEDLEALLRPVANKLGELGVSYYCTFFEEDEFQDKALGPAEIMEHAYSEIAKRDALLVIRHKVAHSVGMIAEVGFARGLVMPRIIATHSDVVGADYLADLGTESFEWDDIDYLVEQLPRILG